MWSELTLPSAPPPVSPPSPPPPSPPPPSPPPPADPMEVTPGGLSLVDALASAAAGVPLIITVMGGHYDGEPIVIDGNSTSSQITISGVPGSSVSDSFIIRASSPPVHLSNLTLTVGANVHVAGGEVSVEGLIFLRGDEVAVGRRLAATDRPISLHGGMLRVRQTVISGIEHGGVLVTGGTLILSDTRIHRCRSDRGAALRVVEGVVTLIRTLLEENVATESGGAVEVEQDGRLILSSQSHLRGNSAPEGASIMIAMSATVTYELPAPLGFWVFISDGST